MKRIISFLLCGVILATSCGTMSNLQRGLGIGAGGGAVAGGIIGALIGHDAKGAAIGAAIGAAVGAGAGAIIGNKMDKKAEELAALENTKVDMVKDANGLNAIKVTFDCGILFATGKSDLNVASQEQLVKFAEKMNDMKDSNLAIYGHTDNTGSDAVNERLSAERAKSVATFLSEYGINTSRMTTEGLSYRDPVASNETAQGRAQNRRVEIYIYASKAMIDAATQEAKNN